MRKWKDCILADLGEIIGGATPSTTNKNYYGGDIVWITPKDLSTLQGRFIHHGMRNITREGLNSCSARLMPKHSILFTSRAPIGYVAITGNEVCTNQGFKSIIPNANTDYLFLYYLLVHNRNRIENMGSGTTFKEVSGSVMKDITVSVPSDIAEQRIIARILGALDDKIENNKAINNHLEQIAQAIFKSWFVDNASNNWKSVKLGTVIQEIRTKVKNQYLPVLSAVRTGNLVLSEEFFTKQVYSKDIGRYIVVEPNDFAYNPARVNIGSIGINTFGFAGCVSPVYIVFRSEPEYHNFFRFFLKLPNFQEELRIRASGSVRQSLSYDNFALIQITYPPIDFVRKFNCYYTDIQTTLGQLKLETACLAAIRDTLLPRLMSGKLSVTDLEDAK